MFELVKVVIKTVVGHQNGRETRETVFWHFFKLKGEHATFMQDVKQNALFYVLLLYYSATIKSGDSE